MFRLNQVVLSHKNKVLLSDVCLDLVPNQITALIGANGAGKSTMMKVMLGEQKVDGGEVIFNERPLCEWTLQQLSFKRAYVAQNDRPVFDIKVYDYLLLAREHHVESLVDACGWVEEVAGIVGVDRFLNTSIMHLSGGEFQLLTFARAWLQLANSQGLKGTVMLLDEPTSALDIKQSQRLYLLLHRFRESGGTVLIIEHDINQANQYSDQIALIKNGKLLVTGSNHRYFSERYLDECFETNGYLQQNHHTDKSTYILNHEWKNNV